MNITRTHIALVATATVAAILLIKPLLSLAVYVWMSL